MRYILSLLLLATISFTNAQSVPQKLNYQAVARNSSGATLTSQSIAVKAEIIDSNQTTVLYSERHVVTTNQFGLFTLQVGGGSVLSGTFSTILWGTSNKYIRTSIDLAGGTTYVLMGMSQLLSVPYALYATDVPVKISSSGDTVKIGNSFVIIPGTSLANPFTTICGKTWMTKNLSVDRYRNGDIIPQVTNSAQWIGLTTGAWCWYNNDSATYASTYGRLYNSYAINDSRGLAPLGWHIARAGELDTLVSCYGGTTADIGGKMKATGTSYWQSPNTGATNISGFTGLPGGLRGNVDFGGNFQGIGTDGWWIFTGANNTYAFRNLSYGNIGLNPTVAFGYYNYFSATTGVSVRCVKD